MLLFRALHGKCCVHVSSTLHLLTQIHCNVMIQYDLDLSLHFTYLLVKVTPEQKTKFSVVLEFIKDIWKQILKV